MAKLIECHVCFGKIADTAKSCPHCGAPRIKEIVKRQITESYDSKACGCGVALTGVACGIISLLTGFMALVGIVQHFLGGAMEQPLRAVLIYLPIALISGFAGWKLLTLSEQKWHI